MRKDFSTADSLSRTEAARYLNVSLYTLKKLADAKLLQPYKKGKLLLYYKKNELDLFFKDALATYICGK